MATISPPCIASAKIALRQPSAVLQDLCRHFEEHGSVTYSAHEGRLETSFGSARLEANETTLILHAEGQDLTKLSYIKWSLAEHLLGFAKDDAPSIEWVGDHAAGQLLPFFSEMTVVGSRKVTPLMQRVTLKGGDIERLATAGLHVRLLLPQPGHEPEWPVMGADGRPRWPEGTSCPIARIYTIRHIDRDAGTIDIDMVLHEGSSPGSDFARNAQAGDVIGMLGPSGGPAPEADWYLLAGDETALPAIARILELLPPQAKAVVRIEVADAAEQQPLATLAQLDLEWVHRDGIPAGHSKKLQEAVEAVSFPQDGSRVYAWGACEIGGFKVMRKFLRGKRGLTKDQHHCAGYWRLAADSHH